MKVSFHLLPKRGRERANFKPKGVIEIVRERVCTRDSVRERERARERERELEREKGREGDREHEGIRKE